MEQEIDGKKCKEDWFAKQHEMRSYAVGDGYGATLQP
jgi:hypothetical protein